MKNRYLHGPAIDQVLAEETFDSMGLSDEVYWQLADNLGSIRDVVTYDGIDTATVVKHLVYSAFGEIIDDTAPVIDVRFAYTGREFDIETGLYYYRARYYDADNGRFISEDPIGFAGGDANLSRYVFNTPANFNDPSGMLVGFYVYSLYWEVFVPTVADIIQPVVAIDIERDASETEYKNTRMETELRTRATCPEVQDILFKDRRPPVNIITQRMQTAAEFAAGMYGSAFGFVRTIATNPSNYRKIFMEHADLPDGWVVHHTLPQEYRELMRTAGVEIDDLQFLVGVDPKIHRKINAKWAAFKAKHNGNPCAADVATFAKEIDDEFKDRFVYVSK